VSVSKRRGGVGRESAESLGHSNDGEFTGGVAILFGACEAVNLPVGRGGEAKHVSKERFSIMKNDMCFRLSKPADIGDPEMAVRGVVRTEEKTLQRLEKKEH